MTEGIFELVFILKRGAAPQELKALGDAIWAWYDDALFCLSQFYLDGGDSRNPKNFNGKELQNLRDGQHPGGETLRLLAYDGHPRYTWDEFVARLQLAIPKDLVADVLVNGLSWNGCSPITRWLDQPAGSILSTLYAPFG